MKDLTFYNDLPKMSIDYLESLRKEKVSTFYQPLKGLRILERK